MPDKSMMNLRKLLLWILVSIIILCALRYGILECANQYIYNLRNTHFPSFALYSGSDHVRNEIGGNKKPEPMEADVDIHRFFICTYGHHYLLYQIIGRCTQTRWFRLPILSFRTHSNGFYLGLPSIQRVWS